MVQFAEIYSQNQNVRHLNPDWLQCAPDVVIFGRFLKRKIKLIYGPLASVKGMVVKGKISSIIREGH